MSNEVRDAVAVYLRDRGWRVTTEHRTGGASRRRCDLLATTEGDSRALIVEAKHYVGPYEERNAVAQVEQYLEDRGGECVGIIVAQKIKDVPRFVSDAIFLTTLGRTSTALGALGFLPNYPCYACGHHPKPLVVPPTFVEFNRDKRCSFDRYCGSEARWLITSEPSNHLKSPRQRVMQVCDEHLKTRITRDRQRLVKPRVRPIEAVTA